MSGVQSFDPARPDLGWQPAIPEPLWVAPRGWRRLLGERSWVPECCGRRFTDRAAYEDHYREEHA